LRAANYVDPENRRPIAGNIDRLQTEFEQLRATYEGKFNEQGLHALAERADKEAASADREFERVLGKHSDFDRTDVEEELRTLPAGMSVAEQKEATEKAYDDSTRQLGPMKLRLESARAKQKAAHDEVRQLEESAPLPTLAPTGTDEEILAEAERLRKEAADQSEWSRELKDEHANIERAIRDLEHRKESLGKDRTNTKTVASAHSGLFDRLAELTALSDSDVGSTISIKTDDDISRTASEIETSLREGRDSFEQLDLQREDITSKVHRVAGDSRFEHIRDSISVRFKTRSAVSLERGVETDIGQIEDRVFHIEENLKTADKQMQIVVDVILSAATEGLDLLGRVSRLSRLPDSLPQAGKLFLKITTQASDNLAERRARIRDLVDELLEQGEVGEGIALIQKAVRRIASPIKVKVLHPDLHQKRPRFDIHELGLFSGGEKLTVAILLYCSLIRLRQQEGYDKSSSSVLVLDNPIGTASRIAFLDMQREVAQAMNVQLIYATAVKDLDAVGCLENIVRLRNSRVDRRSGKRLVEVEANGEAETGVNSIATARVSFDSAPSSVTAQAMDSEEETVE